MATQESPRPALSLLFVSITTALFSVSITATGCTVDSTEPDDDDTPSATSEEDLTFRSAATSSVNLRDGELVLTFDDGPAATSVDVATLLQGRGHTGLFFTVSHHLAAC